MSDSSGIIHPGTIVLYAGMAFDEVGEDWLFCTGETFAQSSWPALYSAIGNRYNTGGEPAGTFRIPGLATYGMRYTTASTTPETFGAAVTHSHALTGIPFPNALDPESGHTHSNSGTTTSTGNNHNHGPNTTAGGNTAGNVGRAVGNSNTHGVGHSHNVNVSAGNAGPHNHNVGVNVNANYGHSHNAATTTCTIGTGNGSVAQPTIDMWYIIKT